MVDKETSVHEYNEETSVFQRIYELNEKKFQGTRAEEDLRSVDCKLVNLENGGLFKDAGNSIIRVKVWV